jgi:hypothetical protein
MAVGGGRGFGVRMMTLDGPGGGMGRAGSGRASAGGVCFMSIPFIVASHAAYRRLILLHYYNALVQQYDPAATLPR